MFELNQLVWVINNNRVENLVVVGLETSKLLSDFSDSIEKNDDYVYLATMEEFRKDNSKNEVKIRKHCVRFMREEVFETKDDLIKSL